ncbi:MAG TPA: protein kinase [Gemmataceae bacterium]|nr:protein kinase [Gemmataceae bacterium]
MPATASQCPDARRWGDLLDRPVGDPVADELTAHLETCAACQRTLDRLTAGDASWPDAAGVLEQGPRPELRRAIERLKAAGEAGRDTIAPTTVVDDRLPFLRPSADPEHLGRLGPYEVLGVLGRGGMGVVLKAFDPALRRLVAIKVLAPQWAVHAQARDRFEREARAAALVRHENVVAIHAVEETDGFPYLVMEYVPGGSLQRLLDRAGPLDLEDILHVGARAAAGLAAAHEQDLIHRDVKPANILLDADGNVRLTDFGLARAVDDTSLTQTGVIAGTPQYMAPEQARGAPLDHRADLFSLGSVLYAMCTGRPPFRAATTVAVLKRVCEDDPRDVRDHNPDVPDWLADIIDRLLEKRPRDRFRSADEVARLLSRHLDHLHSPDLVARPAPIGRPRSSALPRWWPVVLVVPGAVVASLLVWGVVAILTPKRDADSPSPPGQGRDARAPQDSGGPLPRADDDVMFQKTFADLNGGEYWALKGAIERLAGMKPNDRRADVAARLVELADDPSPHIRRPAVKALGVWGSKNEVPALIRATVHSDTFTRREALKVIGRFRDPRTLEPVMACFRDNSTRGDAGDALRDLGAMAEPELVEILNGPEDVSTVFLKGDVISVLTDIGTDASVPALRRVIATRDIHHKRLIEPAQKALAAIEARAKR